MPVLDRPHLSVGQRIKCDECATTAVIVLGSRLYVQHRHHGEVHVTIISLPDLLAMMTEAVAL